MNNHKMIFSPPSRYVLAPSKQAQAAQYRFHSVPFDYSLGFETEVSMASPEWNQFSQLEQCCSGIPHAYHAGHNGISEGLQRESVDLYKEEVPASPYDSWGLTSSRATITQGPSSEWQTPGAYHENVVKDSEDWRGPRVTSAPDLSFGYGEGVDAPRQTPLYSVPSNQEVDQAPSTLLNAPLTDAETSPAFRSSHKTEDSPFTEPQALHGSAWAWLHPTNQYDDMLPRADHAVVQDVAPSPASTAPCGNVLSKNPLLENHYTGLPVWNGPELGFSSSESESKPSPVPSTSFYPGQMLWTGENSSFGSDVPALTYSQASPASDWEDVPAEAQCQNDVVEGPQAAGYSLRNLRQRRIVGPSDEEEAWKNDFLVDKKRAGWTYKMIKQQGGFTEAESTLRGRYRALTKQRKDRVRKPVWQRRDIQLLREAVSKHFVGRFVSNSDVDMYIDPNKILWKDVADYIRDNGGSYHFGNATCKKMWLKIHGHS
ncbi:hypothetical protein IWZ03DRAFT_424778 [Phyllosticta citriasiana]|uniref:Uncharacterized protein n=1 Tax=Phyllosticta citriasiana TaxID=595635 RepID=A0ABR1KHP1_9PEZI